MLEDCVYKKPPSWLLNLGMRSESQKDGFSRMFCKYSWIKATFQPWSSRKVILTSFFTNSMQTHPKLRKIRWFSEIYKIWFSLRNPFSLIFMNIFCAICNIWEIFITSFPLKAKKKRWKEMPHSLIQQMFRQWNIEPP